jgi:hypothetical protein
VAAVLGIGELNQAARAGGDVRRHQGVELATGAGGQDAKAAPDVNRGGLGAEVPYDRLGWRLGPEPALEGVELRLGPRDLQHQALGRVEGLSVEREGPGEPMHEGAESHALHGAVHGDPPGDPVGRSGHQQIRGSSSAVGRSRVRAPP